MNKNQLNAEDSLCWKCKFGLCVREQETERVYHAGMRNMNSDDDFPNMFEEMTLDEETGEQEFIEHIVEHQRIKTVCHWKPPGTENSPPILVCKVHQCNRFEAS